MSYRQRATALALPVLLAVALSGCSLVTPPGPPAPTGTAACALGRTWKADLAALSTQISDTLKRSGIAVTEVSTTGSITFDWNVAGRVVLGNNYVLTIKTAPAADQVLTVVQTVSGEETGAAYINGEVAIPRNWDKSAVTSAVVANNNGTPVDPVPFTLPQVTFDDSVGLELTCAGSALTTHPRGGQITQSWTE